MGVIFFIAGCARDEFDSAPNAINGHQALSENVRNASLPGGYDDQISSVTVATQSIVQTLKDLESEKITPGVAHNEFVSAFIKAGIVDAQKASEVAHNAFKEYLATCPGDLTLPSEITPEVTHRLACVLPMQLQVMPPSPIELTEQEKYVVEATRRFISQQPSVGFKDGKQLDSKPNLIPLKDPIILDGQDFNPLFCDIATHSELFWINYPNMGGTEYGITKLGFWGRLAVLVGIDAGATIASGFFLAGFCVPHAWAFAVLDGAISSTIAAFYPGMVE